MTVILPTVYCCYANRGRTWWFLKDIKAPELKELSTLTSTIWKRDVAYASLDWLHLQFLFLFRMLWQHHSHKAVWFCGTIFHRSQIVCLLYYSVSDTLTPPSINYTTNIPQRMLLVNKVTVNWQAVDIIDAMQDEENEVSINLLSVRTKT